MGSPRTFGTGAVLLLGLAVFLAVTHVMAVAQAPGAPQNGTTTVPTTPTVPTPTQPVVPPQISRPSVGLNTVVLDPAHGGVDLGARGTEGIRESEVVLQFAAQIKQALEGQGFQVILTRQGNDDPSYDDRSARVNGQRGSGFGPQAPEGRG